VVGEADVAYVVDFLDREVDGFLLEGGAVEKKP
jgi:hypothetical protein